MPPWLVEAPVLDRHRGVLQVLRDLRAGDRLADLVGVDHPEQGAVGGVDLRDRPLRDRPEARQRGRRVVDAEQPEPAAEHAEGEDRPEDETGSPGRGSSFGPSAGAAGGSGRSWSGKGYSAGAQRGPQQARLRRTPCARSRRSVSCASRSRPASIAALTCSLAPSGVSSIRCAEVTSPCSRPCGRPRCRRPGVTRRRGHRRGGVARRVVDDDVRAHLLVRHHDQAAVAGVDARVGESDVGDAAVDLVADRDQVADPDRLGDRKQDAGDQVRDHLAAGEADDDPEHRRRGEDAGREALDRGELAEGERDADQDDREEEQAADQAQPGARLARELAGVEPRRRPGRRARSAGGRRRSRRGSRPPA